MPRERSSSCCSGRAAGAQRRRRCTQSPRQSPAHHRLPSPPLGPAPPCSNLQNKGLSGGLPLDTELWSSLDTVQNINLADNGISGYLPPQMSALSNLQYLAVNGNAMTGARRWYCCGQGGGGMELSSQERASPPVVKQH